MIPYREAIEGIDAIKQWLGSNRIEWVMTTVHRWPSIYKYRAAVQVGERTIEGMFVQLEYKAGRVDGAPERLYFGLFVQSSRCFAVDNGGFTRHRNKVGRGLPFYQQTIGHPHMHVPVLEASYGYAEPVENQTAEQLWQLFLERANILGAPKLNLPDDIGQDGQLRLI
ncbi:hypothetical protein CXK93_12240 [Stutzerimonas decontaminans]|uniref:Uncharacterized protein n=1 Tax=Stutzerimonas decontaminans TaxID=3022791 RepID=A0ABX4VYU2_9GAMM|nr:hypothetical protein [Stutzerimonas decontaminans]MCQ4245576.1 hypothetical protein [Stutzerimonas decontaminans]PNF85033.1 hypothetical protein CXK93_12240 [Stutzerimonas decontaminans]